GWLQDVVTGTRIWTLYPLPSLLNQAVRANHLSCFWFVLFPSIHLNVLAIVHPEVFRKFNHEVVTAWQSFAVGHSLVALQFKRFPVLLNVNNDNPRYNLRAFHLDRRFFLRERWLGRQDGESHGQYGKQKNGPFHKCLPQFEGFSSPSIFSDLGRSSVCDL